jgi:hypothetical protein
VLAWAKKKFEAGEMTAEQFGYYDTVATAAIESVKSGEYELVRMGHIASPPGSQYFVGQFVYLHKTKDGHLSGILFNGGDTVLLSDFKPTKKRGKIRKPGTPTHAMLHDPMDIFGKQRREADALATRRMGAPAPAPIQTIEPAFRDFLNGSPF